MMLNSCPNINCPYKKYKTDFQTVELYQNEHDKVYAVECECGTSGPVESTADAAIKSWNDMKRSNWIIYDKSDGSMPEFNKTVLVKIKDRIVCAKLKVVSNTVYWIIEHFIEDESCFYYRSEDMCQLEIGQYWTSIPE